MRHVQHTTWTPPTFRGAVTPWAHLRAIDADVNVLLSSRKSATRYRTWIFCHAALYAWVGSPVPPLHTSARVRALSFATQGFPESIRILTDFTSSALSLSQTQRPSPASLSLLHSLCPSSAQASLPRSPHPPLHYSPPPVSYTHLTLPTKRIV